VGSADDVRAANRLARLLAVSRTLRRQLLDLTDERTILDVACRAAVEIGHFGLARIGVADRAGGARREVARWGDDDGYTEAVEFPIVRASGPYGALTVCASEPDSVDALSRFVLEGVAEDIGVALDACELAQARADAEARLRASERRHRAIFEHASDGIFLAGADHRYIDVNPAGASMLGYTREELLARSIEELIVPEELLARPVSFALGATTPGVSFFAERRLRRKDGTVIDVELHAVRLADGTLQSVCRDVSERRRAHAEHAATERMASLGRLAQGIGHEINNPLAYLMLNLELARLALRDTAPALHESLSSAMTSAEDGAARIARIVRALASFGRGDGETVRPVQIARVVDDALTLTKNRLRHVAEVDVDVDSAPPIRANDFQLVQVFVNLLLNAADAMEGFTRDRHVLAITARGETDGRVTVVVADTGPGIPPSDRERVFDPFFTTKAIGRGTGIGLSISKAILATFGGTIEVDDARNDGAGAVFRIGLGPASLTPVATVATKPPPAATKRLRVLVVDDEPLIGRIIERALPQHDVVVLDNVPAALEACMRDDFDRILCDLMLPGVAGDVLFTTLERDRPELARRVVFMTGGAFTPGAQGFLERVTNRCIDKPFSVSTLHAAVFDEAAR
jgi:PAS domain S-box-containing protein